MNRSEGGGFGLQGNERQALLPPRRWSKGARLGRWPLQCLDCFGSRGSRLGRGCFDAGRGEPFPYKVWLRVTSGGER